MISFSCQSYRTGPKTVNIVCGKEEPILSILEGRQIIIIGDRDGIPSQAIEACVKTAGGQVVFASTECFV